MSENCVKTPADASPPVSEPSFDGEFAKMAQFAQVMQELNETLQEVRFGIEAVAVKSKAALQQLNFLPQEPEEPKLA